MTFVSLLIVASGVALVVYAQGSYDLSWWTTDGGGGYSSGGSYTVHGTAGQAEAGLSHIGGDYTVTGGFWVFGEGQLPTPTTRPSPTWTTEPSATRTAPASPTNTVRPGPTDTFTPGPSPTDTDTAEPGPSDTPTAGPGPSETPTPDSGPTNTPSPAPYPYRVYLPYAKQATNKPDVAFDCFVFTEGQLALNVANVGATSLPDKQFRLQLYVDGVKTLNTSIDPKRHSVREPGRSTALHVPMRPGWLESGHTLRAVVDATDVLDEDDESNNEMTFSFAKAPQLTITKPTVYSGTGLAIAAAGRQVDFEVVAQDVAPSLVELMVDDEPGARASGPGPYKLSFAVPDSWRERDFQACARARVGDAKICSPWVSLRAVKLSEDFDRRAGEYFLEMALGADFMGEHFFRTNRFVSDPVFYFANGRGTKGEADVKRLLKEAVTYYTAGKYEARFRSQTSPPADPNSVVTITFTNTSRGEALPRRANHGNGGAIAITGGNIKLSSSFLTGVDEWNLGVPPHELGHVMIGHGNHTALPSSLMSQGGRSIQPYERAAWHLLYQLPLGTDLDSLTSAGVITPEMLDVRPAIIRTYVRSQWPSGPNLQGKVGQELYLYGTRLQYKFGCGTSLEFPDPVVRFNGALASVSTEHSISPTCNTIVVTVPQGATTGPLTVSAYGRTSDPVQFTVLP